MPELQRLRPDHSAAVLVFEVTNRAYFADSISDRVDDFFDYFGERHQAQLDDQQAGAAAFHVLVDDDGSVLGRFNLIFLPDAWATLGYRVAQRATGRGAATAAVGKLCELASAEYGLLGLRAATSLTNVASQKVLLNSGFRPVSPANPGDLGGKPGTWYERSLTDR